MATITACMIVKNEEFTISSTLSTIIPLFNQIIIVDLGSTDNTKKILSNIKKKRSTCEIIYKEFEWNNDYSEARNFSYKFATCDYVTWWNTTDRVGGELIDLIKDIKNNLYPNIQVFRIPTLMEFHEDGSPKLQLCYNRIILRSLFLTWNYKIKEELIIDYNLVSDDRVMLCSTSYWISYEFRKRDNEEALERYNQLLSDGYEFTGRDWYFFFIELCINKDYSNLNKWMKVATSNNYDLSELKYFVILYQYLSANKLETVVEVKYLLGMLIFHGLCSAELCCWVGDYFYNSKYYSAALMWYRNALDNHNDWIVYDELRDEAKYDYPIAKIKSINNL